MRLGPLLAPLMTLMTGQLVQAQLPDALKAAYDANQVFELRHHRPPAAAGDAHHTVEPDGQVRVTADRRRDN